RLQHVSRGDRKLLPAASQDPRRLDRRRARSRAWRGRHGVRDPEGRRHADAAGGPRLRQGSDRQLQGAAARRDRQRVPADRLGQGAEVQAEGVGRADLRLQRAGVMVVRPHDRFAAEVTITREDAADYARRAGDGNPIHHDAVYAAGTRFGRPIASGAQTTGLLMGLTATHFSRGSAMLGLDFWFRFRRPVFVDETVRLEWLRVAVRPAPRLGGDVVELRGRLRNAAGETAVGAKGRVLVTERL